MTARSCVRSSSSSLPRWSSWLVLGATVVACTPPAPPPPPPDEENGECALDLNQDTTGAEAIVPGTPATGLLCPQFDQDLFAFDVATPGVIVQLTLSMDTAQTRVNPAYRILKDDGTATGAPTPFSGEDPQKSQGEPTNFTAAHRLPDVGRYYVLVSDARFVDETFDVVNPYALRINLVPDPDVQEPNGNDATATVVASGTSVTAQLATVGDEDWYAIDVPAGAQVLDVVVDGNADSGVNVVATLVAADGQTELLGAPLQAPTPPTGRVGARLRSRVVGGERTYVVIKDDDGVDSQLDPALGGYTVTFTVLGNPDANEGDSGNDDPATATSAGNGTTLVAALATTADQDLYRVDGGSSSRNAPKVLVVELDWQGPIDARTFQPQVTVLGVDPEVDNRACNAACAFCDEALCKTARLQRFVDKASFQTAFPLRDGSDALVLVNEVGDDAFQDGVGYTIRFTVIDDPDPGERGDDFLIPNLEFAGFANGDDLDRQLQRSRERARVLGTAYPAVCADGADPVVEQCLPLEAVPDPVPGINEDATQVIDCDNPNAAPVQLTATGRLTYEGDRDYFRLDLPPRGYFALDFDYALSGSSTTPLELALFVYNARGNRPIANTLEATQTQGSCLASFECPAGSICVDGACWSESDDNPTFAAHAFPEGGECSFVSPFDSPFDATTPQPFLLEVVDNGINDFDTDVTYSFTVDVRCGCPVACNPGTPANNRCQGVADPR
jgi:hypothetical protein